MQAALDYLYPYVGEMFLSDTVDAALVEAGIALIRGLRADYDDTRPCLRRGDADAPGRRAVAWPRWQDAPNTSGIC